MALFDKSPRSSARPNRSLAGSLFGWLGSREIDKRVITNFPTWQEFSERKLKDAQERKEQERFHLPPHKVYVSSPLHWNFMYLLFAAGALVLAYANPQWAGYLIYGAIAAAAAVAVFVTLRDGLTFHLEGARLEVDGDMINARHAGDQEQAEPGKEKKTEPRDALGRKHTVFRSKLLQIHYQNILRTFESGNRRAWVYQDASIADIETLLSQRGMKLAWTCIEVLPQLGLLGTLVGMVQMFSAFRTAEAAPDISILGGFATALGTTLLANMFVLVLRPLHMRNERSMHEILSTLQMLMAMFILPTQQFVLERQGQQVVHPYAGQTGYGPVPTVAVADRRLTETLDRLADTLAAYGEMQRTLDSGSISRETAAIAQDVRTSLRALREVFDPRQFEEQQRAFEQLSRAINTLAERLDQPLQVAPAGPGGERVEHDLMQLRVLTRDTLILLDQIAGHLQRLGGRVPNLLSADSRLRETAFTGEEAPPSESQESGSEAVRLFRERG
jgi:biopolymer transport protein ExbB/TolQ